VRGWEKGRGAGKAGGGGLRSGGRTETGVKLSYHTIIATTMTATKITTTKIVTTIISIITAIAIDKQNNGLVSSPSQASLVLFFVFHYDCMYCRSNNIPSKYCENV